MLELNDFVGLTIESIELRGKYWMSITFTNGDYLDVEVSGRALLPTSRT